MPYYMGLHTLPGFSREMLTQATPALEQLNGKGTSEARFLRAMSSFGEGRVVCEFEAPSKEALAAVYGRLGFPYDAIIQVDAVCDAEDGRVTTTDV
jgi:hypothetical protein